VCPGTLKYNDFHKKEQGIVQITNLKKVAKAIVISITDWSKVQVLPGPPLLVPLKRWIFRSLQKKLEFL
jgi:hypothetical protein